MNDRFKFRAKLNNMDKWIVGAYLKMLPYQPNPVGHRKPLETEYKHLIITEGSADWGMPREIAAYEVIPETVGQCTGLKDKNGKLIFEGDIIKIPDNWDEYGMFAGEIREVYFNEGGFRLKPKWDKNSRGNWLEDTKDFEVIGNIYENKELLESEW